MTLRHRPEVDAGELVGRAKRGLSLRAIGRRVGLSHEAVRLRLAGLVAAHNR
jgi:hypothetical protein